MCSRCSNAALDKLHSKLLERRLVQMSWHVRCGKQSWIHFVQRCEQKQNVLGGTQLAWNSSMVCCKLEMGTKCSAWQSAFFPPFLFEECKMPRKWHACQAISSFLVPRGSRVPTRPVVPVEVDRRLLFCRRPRYELFCELRDCSFICVTYATASRYRAPHARQARMYNRLQAGARLFRMDVARDSHNLCSLFDRVPLPENIQILIPGEHIDTVLGKKEVLSLATRCRSAFSSVTLLLIFHLPFSPVFSAYGRAIKIQQLKVSGYRFIKTIFFPLMFPSLIILVILQVATDNERERLAQRAVQVNSSNKMLDHSLTSLHCRRSRSFRGTIRPGVGLRRGRKEVPFSPRRFPLPATTLLLPQLLPRSNPTSERVLP